MTKNLYYYVNSYIRKYYTSSNNPRQGVLEVQKNDKSYVKNGGDFAIIKIECGGDI